MPLARVRRVGHVDSLAAVPRGPGALRLWPRPWRCLEGIERGLPLHGPLLRPARAVRAPLEGAHLRPPRVLEDGPIRLEGAVAVGHGHQGPRAVGARPRVPALVGADVRVHEGERRRHLRRVEPSEGVVAHHREAKACEPHGLRRVGGEGEREAHHHAARRVGRVFKRAHDAQPAERVACVHLPGREQRRCQVNRREHLERRLWVEGVPSLERRGGDGAAATCRRVERCIREVGAAGRLEPQGQVAQVVRPRLVPVGAWRVRVPQRRDEAEVVAPPCRVGGISVAQGLHGARAAAQGQREATAEREGLTRRWGRLIANLRREGRLVGRLGVALVCVAVEPRLLQSGAEIG
eukprot:scaffold117691_cov77-Phaeocystis_antarctica.AAC.7